ncbi:ATP-binding protein, partial [Streptomyces sp. NPDC006265]|uniref:ATP-binding protein n=1 Tax=Streptomyces sp. NPDC006265 TaxID=3156740 RepID=UPI0033B56630
QDTAAQIGAQALAVGRARKDGKPRSTVVQSDARGAELVTNACLHAEGPDQLRITCDNKVIRVEVADRGTGQPAPRTPHRAGRPGGHGMFIVQRLCLDWGVVRTPGVSGKTVWAELGVPA